MIQINLLGATAKRRGAAPRSGSSRTLKLPAFGGDPWVAGLAAVGVLVLLLVGFGYWRADARQAELQAEIEKALTDSTQLTTAIALSDQLKAQQDTVAQRIELIRSVDQRRYVWPHLMDEISRSVPAYTWLNSLTSSPAEEEGAGPVVTVQGSTGSTQALTRFMKNLEASPFLRDVTLVTSAQTSEQGRSFQRFTVEARYQQADSAAVQTIPIVASP